MARAEIRLIYDVNNSGQMPTIETEIKFDRLFSDIVV